jgi:hypothetical protein
MKMTAAASSKRDTQLIGIHWPGET